MNVRNSSVAPGLGRGDHHDNARDIRQGRLGAPRLNGGRDGGRPMKVALAAMLLVGAATFAVAAGEKITVKYDLGSENPQRKVVTGDAAGGASGGPQVLGPAAENQTEAGARTPEPRLADR